MISIKRAGVGFMRTIVLVVFLGVAGFLGWFVWQSKINTEKSLNNTDRAQTAIIGNGEKNTEIRDQVPAGDITADWTPFSSQEGKFSLRYPRAWVQPSNRDLCSPELFKRAIYLGPDAESVLKCASEYFGQMSVSSVEGDKRAEYNMDAGYKEVTKKEVVVSGVTGHRISGVTAAASPGGAFSPIEGTIEVRYVFFTNGNTYVARYTQAPKGHSPSTNVMSDFDLMVTKTLKFSA